MFMGLFGVVFAVIFALVFINIARGIWVTSRMSGKVFDLVERQLDRQLSERDGAAREAAKPQCAHCGSSVGAGEKCPNCGATLV